MTTMTPISILLAEIWKIDGSFYIKQAKNSQNVLVCNHNDAICFEAEGLGNAILRAWLHFYSGKEQTNGK